ncbi:MAG: hypothetical protein K8T20_12190, partial [Planctomycetes bacterium]|nr:hypothetical protein [Planctomycetota bacterium]
MTLLAELPSQGFQYAVFVYLAAAMLSFAAAGSMFWRRRRQVGRHVPAALALGFLIGALQLIVIVSLAKVRGGDYERTFFRDMMHTSAVVFLPAFFISGFVMAAAGAYLSERVKTAPFPVSRQLELDPGKAVRPLF